MVVIEVALGNRRASHNTRVHGVFGVAVVDGKNSTALMKVVVKSQWSITQQEWMPLHLSDPEPIHIPSIRERAECLISRFKGKSDRPPKVILMHGLACFLLSLKPHVL